MGSSGQQSRDASVVTEPGRAESGAAGLWWKRYIGNIAEIIINPQYQGFPCGKPEPRVAAMKRTRLCQEIREAYLDLF